MNSGLREFVGTVGSQCIENDVEPSDWNRVVVATVCALFEEIEKEEEKVRALKQYPLPNDILAIAVRELKRRFGMDFGDAD